MMMRVDLEQCLKDSPSYRTQLRLNSEQINLLEERYEQIFRMCNALLSNGKVLLQDFQKFLQSFGQIGEVIALETPFNNAFHQFSHSLREIQNLCSNLLEQTSHGILRVLTRMIKEDIRKVKEQSKLFDRLSTDYDLALQRNADAPKSKVHLCDDASKILVATGSCFAHTSIDYAYQINSLFDQHRLDFFELILSLMNCYKTFFHQGYELMAIDRERDFQTINSQISQMRLDAVEKKRDFERIHQINQQRFNVDDPSTSLSMSPHRTLSTQLEGYLFKRSHNKFKSWHRRWFFIRQGQLLYLKRSTMNNSNPDLLDPSASPSVLISDIRLCTIRPHSDHERRFVFEIISPSSSHLLQADSQCECDLWISSLQLTITTLFKSSDESTVEDRPTTTTTEKIELRQKMIQEKIDFVRQIPGNDKCCDCDADAPEWASINLGILLCVNCGGAHRGLGVNLSKVRSLHMDTWEFETLLVMSELGNIALNHIYEANVPHNVKKPTSDTDPITRRQYIEAKYVQKSFLRPLAPPSHPPRSSARTIKRWTVMKTAQNFDNDDESTVQSFRLTQRQHQSTTNQSLRRRTASPTDHHHSQIGWNVNEYLYEGARHAHLSMMLHGLALGAEKNYHHHQSEHGRTPLIAAIRSRSVAAAQFLLINNAKVNLPDHDGRTPLHYATELAKKGRGPIILLLKHGADPSLKDRQGVDACALAMTEGDPDVITWFRLIALHEQMKEEDDHVEKSYITILDDPVYIQELARSPSFS